MTVPGEANRRCQIQFEMDGLRMEKHLLNN
jgi:hypothetical protein